MKFSDILLTLASVAMATAAPTTGNSSAVDDVAVVGDWRTSFTPTDQPQKNCEVLDSKKNEYDLADLKQCQNLATHFRNRNGYYSLSGWQVGPGRQPGELVSWGTCHIRVSNLDNANTVYVGNHDLANFMDTIFKMRDDGKAGGWVHLSCKQAGLGVSVTDIPA